MKKIEARRAIELKIHGDINAPDWEPMTQLDRVIDLLAEILVATSTVIHDTSDPAQVAAVVDGVPISITRELEGKK